jgi:RNA recognition motif-containing protein
MNSKLYVGNLSFKTTEGDLRDAFGQFGSVTDVYVATDRETGRPRGFAFVTFSTDTESKLAVEKMNGTELDGRQLTVNEAKPKEEMGGAGGGNRNFSSPNRRAGAFQARGNRRF